MPGRRVQAREAAELLGCSTRLVQKLCITGEMPAAKVGSIWTVSTSAIEEYLARRQPLPAPPPPVFYAPSYPKRSNIVPVPPDVRKHYEELIGVRPRTTRNKRDA